MTESKKYKEAVMAKKAKIAELSAYLVNGVYAFDKDLRVVFNTEKTTHPMLRNLQNTEKEVRVSLEIEESGLKRFRGSVLWFCINGDIRIFSDDNVLVLCAEKESYQRKVENRAYFSAFFRIPEIISQDAEHNMLTEAFVPFEDKTDDDEAFMLKTIYYDYCAYFNYLALYSKVDYQSLNGLSGKSSNAIHIRRFEKIMGKVPPELLSENFPFVNLHGDMWSDNILLSCEAGKKALWYIDWETAGKYIFFYDFFKFMWNELDVHHDYSHYKKYAAGEFDEKLARLFAIFHLKFQPEFRQAYFCLFFLNFVLNDSDHIAFEYKCEEITAFERKVFPLMSQ